MDKARWVDDTGAVWEASPLQIHAESAEGTSRSGWGTGTVLAVSLLAFVVGTAFGARSYRQMVARGADMLPLDTLRTPHPTFAHVVRDPEYGWLLRVNGNDVVARSGDVFAWESIGEDREPVYRAANLYTGKVFPEVFATINALEEVFDYDIVPALLAA